MAGGLFESFWSRIVWAAGVITFLASAVWAALTYAHGNRLALERPLIDKQIAICFDISDVVGALASTDDPTVFATQRQVFLGHFWGDANMVEDPKVAGAMGDFKDKLMKTGFDHRDQLQFDARNVVVECREQIETTISKRWRISWRDVLGFDF
jgi:hypothetical protein